MAYLNDLSKTGCTIVGLRLQVGSIGYRRNTSRWQPMATVHVRRWGLLGRWQFVRCQISQARRRDSSKVTDMGAEVCDIQRSQSRLPRFN